MASITVEQVRELCPDTISGLADSLLQAYIDIVTSLIDEDLENIFTTSTVTEADLQNYTTQSSVGSHIISIGAWQETGLTLKKVTGTDITATVPLSEVLTLGEDYLLWYNFTGNKIIGKPNRVTAIKLLKRRLYADEYLRVYGTYGWFPVGGDSDYPSDVKQLIATLVTRLASYAKQVANSDGGVGIAREKDLTSEIEYDSTFTRKLEQYVQSLYYNPTMQSLLQRYRLGTQETVTVI